MSANTLGKLFTVTTAGESHGEALVAIVDGCPPNIPLNNEIIQYDLDRRKPGGKFTTQRRELDLVKILSGVFEGVTTGTPIALLIENTDQKSKDYSDIMYKFRPSHADYAYMQKYGIRDYRGGGRASARETAMRVAAGAVARTILKQYGVQISAYLSQIGEIEIPFVSLVHVNDNEFFSPNNEIIAKLEEYIKGIRKQQDSIGAKVSVIIDNVPVGLGAPVFDKLDAELAKSFMSINAAKGVEIGAGFASITQKGSQHRDELTSKGFLSNNSGGITGGITTGQQITANIAFKPTPSIAIPGKTIDINGSDTKISTKGRHDPCVGIRAVAIVEAMAALVLCDHLLRHIAQNYSVSKNYKSEL